MVRLWQFQDSAQEKKSSNEVRKGLTHRLPRHEELLNRYLGLVAAAPGGGWGVLQFVLLTPELLKDKLRHIKNSKSYLSEN